MSTKDQTLMTQTSNAVAGATHGLRQQLQLLNEGVDCQLDDSAMATLRNHPIAIRANENSKAEYERTLSHLNEQRSLLETRIQNNRHKATDYDNGIGPFTAK